MISNIITEMTKGNFSFLILVVGIVQVIIMLKNYALLKKQDKENNDKKISLE
jgi:hypothetical protein